MDLLQSALEFAAHAGATVAGGILYAFLAVVLIGSILYYHFVVRDRSEHRRRVSKLRSMSDNELLQEGRDWAKPFEEIENQDNPNVCRARLLLREGRFAELHEEWALLQEHFHMERTIAFEVVGPYAAPILPELARRLSTRGQERWPDWAG